jgi:streptogramin lyase
MRIGNTALFAVGSVLMLSITQASAQSTVRGTVTDSAGKPIRGALIKILAGPKTISHYTDAAGKYEITGISEAKYTVSAEAFGFAPKSRKDVDTLPADFALTARWDISRLTSAEWESTLPDDRDTKMVISSCIGCHGLEKAGKMQSFTSAEWQAFLPRMTLGRMFAALPKSKIVGYSETLEKLFGPEAHPPTRERVTHMDIPDKALKATFREYRTPTFSMPHSIIADPKALIAWVAEYDYQSNNIARFDMEAETFEEYPVLTPNSLPHTPLITDDGRIWTPGNGANNLIVVDGKTRKLTEYSYEIPGAVAAQDTRRPTRVAGGHTLAADKQGNLWLSATNINTIWKFNIANEKFEAFDVFVPKEVPADSMAGYQMTPGEPPAPLVRSGSYDIATDSKGGIWYSQLWTGTLVHFDPATKINTPYRVPGLISIRGILIDREDNVWFGNFHGHRLAKFDASTKTIKQYKVPNPFATPYGFALDERRGLIWFADLNGNNITSFDPKTEKFVEYPIPTLNANPRFISLDIKGRIWFGEFTEGKIGVLDPG